MEVKKYLAYWFQLGKKIVISNRNQSLIPPKIFNDHGYSAEFEEVWHLVTQDSVMADCYLEGTNQTIKQLLSSEWDIVNCARCNMPVPMKLGVQDCSCVCDDLENWPNNQLPIPRSPVNSQDKLIRIHKSIVNKQKKDD